ncbi:AarF/ABC1/UbiB kinase family protein [Lentisphaera marina]|uniref:ABC1 kinase family protein n=1 Tax=Lentisphaera marina TaxID=1111041 RepID=UPI002365B753|nr:AarF/ABC1/UbiB kinase family protein [Lentisphaera marina]MDD7983762.1 AarF/ABC1/UbiB kinase family protein [Lentisphaera marina]
MKPLKSIPSSKVGRAGKVAVAGLKIGGNYLKHYGKKVSRQTSTQEDLDKANAADVYGCLSEMKGSALKVAQMLSMDRGALPKAYTDQFALAQYQSPPLSAPLVQKILKRELGKKADKVFQKFSPQAERAASIGQVHKAEYEGQEVAIKLQYPGVAESISSDLKLVKPFALKLLKLKSDEVKTYFSEIENKMLEETRYLQELEQGMSISDKCKDLDYVKFPKYFSEISSNKLLVMEWLHGKHLDEFFSEDIPQEKRNAIGQKLWDFYHVQMHNLHWLHADPHPGNFLIDETGKLNVIDFGCMKKVPKSFYDNYFLGVDKSLFNDDKRFHKNLLDLEILRSDDNPKAVKFFTKNFKKLMNLAMRPFHFSEFDFADESFFMELYEMGDRIKREQDKEGHSHNRGSKHFIYTNRTYYGLYNILSLLKAKVKIRAIH